MEILGIGIAELLFIVLLILVLFKPKDMANTGKTLGRWLNQLVNSPTYKLLTRTGSELKNLPRNLMKESNYENSLKELESTGGDIIRKTNSFLNGQDFSGRSIAPPRPGNPSVPDVEKKKPDQEIPTPKLPGEDF